MTDEKTLPPLTLDDVRVVEPDRDAEEAFDAKETWIAACDRIQAGYPAADVADLLMQLDDDERGAVADYWHDHTLDTIGSPGLDGRDFHCPDIRLALAMQEREPDCDEWTCAPTLEPASLWETVVEFDRLQAENAKLRAALEAPRLIIVEVEGGMVQGVSADGPCAVEVLDYDTDGREDARDVPQSDGKTARAVVDGFWADVRLEAIAWVQGIHKGDWTDEQPEGAR